jgi:hypothetical protein
LVGKPVSPVQSATAARQPEIDHQQVMATPKMPSLSVSRRAFENMLRVRVPAPYSNPGVRASSRHWNPTQQRAGCRPGAKLSRRSDDSRFGPAESRYRSWNQAGSAVIFSENIKLFQCFPRLLH